MQAEVSNAIWFKYLHRKRIYIGKVNDVVLEVSEKKATVLRLQN